MEKQITLFTLQSTHVADLYEESVREPGAWNKLGDNEQRSLCHQFLQAFCRKTEYLAMQAMMDELLVKMGETIVARDKQVSQAGSLVTTITEINTDLLVKWRANQERGYANIREGGAL